MPKIEPKTNVICSIKPKWVEKIKNGSKTVEIRKQVPNFADQTVNGNQPRTWIWYLYESAPVKLITGFFKVGQIFSGTPEELWKKVKNKCGMTKEQFFKYCDNPNKTYYGLEIEDLGVWKDDIFDPYKRFPGFKPGQNFRYLNENEVNELLKFRKG
ncbi:type I restriction enzyme S subunit [Methanococcus maripaludis]|uniref:Type I restriction enzyme S subunit n=1 Tax=Methanococcus maripaludis TaxID=39152 RepID=A0A7J9P6G0_METMI|nr:hypothetical protein [Methanococcus maripaludis]MBA2858276.1 type I restriction enzyme S subunit [Methanococcus maripaludis]